MKRSISEKAQSVLEAIAEGNDNRENVAYYLGISIPSVNGSLTGLKRNGLIEVEDDGTILLTEDADEFLPEGSPASRQYTPRPGSKMAHASKLFNRLFDKGRQAVLAAFRDQVGLTERGAATYYQTLRERSGMVHGVAAQKGRRSRRKSDRTSR